MAYDSYVAAIEDLLACAYVFDDKPHLLFSCVRRIALQYEENSDDRQEVARLMDAAYNKDVHRCCKTCAHWGRNTETQGECMWNVFNHWVDATWVCGDWELVDPEETC